MQSLEEDRILLRQYRDTDTVVGRAGVAGQVERARSVNFTCLPAGPCPALAAHRSDSVCKAMRQLAKACHDCHANSVQMREISMLAIYTTLAHQSLQPLLTCICNLATVWC